MLAVAELAGHTPLARLTPVRLRRITIALLTGALVACASLLSGSG